MLAVRKRGLMNLLAHLGLMFPRRNGSSPVSLPEDSGVLPPSAGVPMPLSGLIVPDGGTGILISSGLPGTSFDCRSGMWMRLALLL